MRKNLILGLAGLTLFFLVITVLYSLMVITEGREDILFPFMPFIVLSGFFIFLIGAVLLALSIFRMFDRKSIV